MESLSIINKRVTLVDQVEDRLIEYFKEKGLRPGDSIPHEVELAQSLGVARSVLREALSRFKMNGMIESRTRRGMILTEPSLMSGLRRIVNPMWMTDKTLCDILELRISIEIGMTDLIFDRITDEDVAELEEIVQNSILLANNKYNTSNEFDFHAKLYRVTRDETICQFQEIIHPVMGFVKEKYNDVFEPIAARISQEGKAVSHSDLLECLKNRDRDAYLKAIRQHFAIYMGYRDSING